MQLAVFAMFSLVLLAAGCAGPVPLRVGTSGDYAPFSDWHGDRPEGFDIAVAEAFAADRGRPITWVRLRWPDLVADLEAGRFDLAMSGVTVRPERTAAGIFSLPVARSGAVALVRDGSRFRRLADLDRAGVRVAVNAGGHLERVARARLARATLEARRPNRAVLDALLAGEVDAAVTDSVEMHVWLEARPELTAIGPFTTDRKAYLARADASALMAELDAWLLAQESDGTLGGLRRRWLGDATRVATVLDGMVSALAERLSLMPDVARAKRAAGLPIEVPEVERRVLRSSGDAVRAAADAAERPAPPAAAVCAFYRAQIEAAKAVQRATPRSLASAPDLDGVLRPAIGRVGARIAWLLVRWPRDLTPDDVRRAVARGLRTPGVSDADREHIADALIDFSAGRGDADACPGAFSAGPSARQRARHESGDHR